MTSMRLSGGCQIKHGRIIAGIPAVKCLGCGEIVEKGGSWEGMSVPESFYKHRGSFGFPKNGWYCRACTEKPMGSLCPGHEWEQLGTLLDHFCNVCGAIKHQA
jgi:hypothetical protein